MPKKRVKLIVLIAAILCGAIVIGLILQRIYFGSKTVPNVSNKPSTGFDVAEGVKMTVPGTTPNTYWELRIHQIKSMGDVDKFTQVEGVYFMNKTPLYQMSGKNGAVYLATHKLEIYGNVILKAIDGSKELNTAKLVWAPGANTVTAHGDVMMKTPQAMVTTEELIANLNMDHATFNGQTKVFYQGTN